MGLRTKILSGFSILAVMLFIAGVWSVYELTNIGISVQRLLDDNYKSINAGRMMIEALEREDSAVLLLLFGKWKEGRSIIGSADSSFQQAFKAAQKNVTIIGEQTYVDAIGSRYKVYKDLWMKPIVDTSKEGNLNWYFQEAHQAFLGVKLSVEKLVALNSQAMYQTASNLKNRAHRAIMPGIIAILSALIFTLIFNFLINYYVVSPIVKITKSLQESLESKKPLSVEIETKDELLDLVSSIDSLVTQLRAAKTMR